MTDPFHACTRASRYRDAAQRLREAVDLAGEAGAPQDTVDAIQALAERMARAAEEIGGDARDQFRAAK